MFITFEGIEGSGKTTQIRLLYEYLIQSGRKVLHSKEPGGTPFGLTMRQILLNPEQKFHHLYSELLLFYADRLEHIAQVVRPTLASGGIVLVDRYIDSTYAYQCGGRGLSKQVVETLNALVDTMPSLTLLCDLPVEEGLRRAKNRAGLDRFEQEDITFHTRVREGYLERATEDPTRIRTLVCADKSVSEIHQHILDIVKEFGL